MFILLNYYNICDNDYTAVSLYLFILFIWDNGNKGEWLQKIDPRLRQSPLLHVDKVTWQRPVVAIEKVGNMGL